MKRFLLILFLVAPYLIFLIGAIISLDVDKFGFSDLEKKVIFGLYCISIGIIFERTVFSKINNKI